MKKLLLIAAFVAFSAQAETMTVQASGFGDTCEQALTAAKRSALDKVNGAWVHSVERVSNGKHGEEIFQYSGGVIKSYKYLRDDCTYVIIEAEVVKQSNKVQSASADVDRGQVIHLQGIKDAQDRKQLAIQRLNNRSEAVYFKPEVTEFKSIEGTTDVSVEIKGKFAYNDKWKADYKTLREEFGYFNLTSFADSARITVSGLDAAREGVFKTSFYSDDWKLWTVRTYGATRTMDINVHKTEEATIRFRIPMSKLEKVRSFVVTL